jgi:hypothetical protein
VGTVQRVHQFPYMGGTGEVHLLVLLFERCLRNNRIRLEPFFDQHCALSDDFEPMLLVGKNWFFFLPKSWLRLMGTILPAATINRNTTERVQRFDFA